jgi:hypothetical protein
MKAVKAMIAIRVEVSKELHKRVKMQALQDDVSLQRCVVLALEAFLAQKARLARKAQVRG